MRGNKTPIDQLEIVPHPGGNCYATEIASLGGKELAYISGSGQIR